MNLGSFLRRDSVTCHEQQQEVLPVYGRDLLQVSDSHERLVKVVQLQDTGQQEEAGDQNASEEFRQSKGLQADRCQPEDDRATPWAFQISAQVVVDCYTLEVE